MPLSLSVLGLTLSRAGAETGRANPNARAGDVIVHGQFGGNIFGFELDPDGTEGLLCEAVGNSDGTVLAAVETFDPATGQIIKVVRQTETQDDFIALAITGRSIGLVEREQVNGLFHVNRSYVLLDPLEGNAINGAWSAPVDRKHVIFQVKPSLDGRPDVAVYALSINLGTNPVVFRSDVARNSFGPVIEISDPSFTTEAPPVLAFDPARDQAILGHDQPSPFILPPRLGFVNLTTGKFDKVIGLGLGVINGIAVDSDDAVLCTTTSFDFGVQFYNLITHTGINVPIQGADDGLFAGQDVEFDPVNKLFLIAQTFSSTSSSDSSSIQVYDIAGNFVESIDGFHFQGGFDVFPVHITLNPVQRTGFVNGPDLTTAIQSFSY